jgi:amino acid adenylation domain-containing protein
LPEREDLPLLHAWLNQAADRWPDRPAIVETDRETTLAELRSLAAAMATTFRQRGVVPGDRVALVMDKSRDAIVALYGALMAGAVYVPIPPSWPQARIDAVLRDSGARIVATHDGNAGSGAPRLYNPGTGATMTRPAADAPAFILFTSGSTGTPKGVAISHAAAGAFVDWTAREFGLGPDDRIACPSPLSFDLSTFDVLNIARSASACVLLPEPTRWVPRLLFQALAELCVTAWYSVPSALNAVGETPDVVRGRLAGVRLFLLAGEVFPSRLAVALRRTCPHARILNLYGPTETNVVTWHELPAVVDPVAPVPIGTTCPYASAYIVEEGDDSHGVGRRTGELLVSGQSLMIGYWNRPEEDARAFTEIDRTTEPVRWYRTGDRVSVGPDGQIQFIGRLDRQIKRRGIRIELGEIEAVLGQHPAVAEAAVVASGGHPSVVTAFVRLGGGVSASADALRLHCAVLLPASMLPDRWVILADMPRGNRGKIDYERLSSWEPTGA